MTTTAPIRAGPSPEPAAAAGLACAADAGGPNGVITEGSSSTAFAELAQRLLRYAGGAMRHVDGQQVTTHAVSCLLALQASAGDSTLALGLVSDPATRDPLLTMLAALARLARIQGNSSSSSSAAVPNAATASATQQGAAAGPEVVAIGSQQQHWQQREGCAPSSLPAPAHQQSDPTAVPLSATNEANTGQTVMPEKAEAFALRVNGCNSLKALTALAGIICNALLSKTAAPAAVEFARRMLRTQVLHCCSRLLASAAGEVRRCLQRGPVSMLQPSNSSAGGGAGVGSKEWDGQAGPVTQACSDLVQAGLSLLLPLCMLAASAAFNNVSISLAPTTTEEQQRACAAYVSELSAALRDSCVLEHAAAALLLTAQLAADADAEAAAHAADAAATAATQARPGVAHSILQVMLPSWCESLRALNAVCFCVEPVGQLEAAAALSEALSGRCLRHLALTMTTAALAAADGGPAYGMQPALLRALPLPGLPVPSAPVVCIDVCRLPGTRTLHVGFLELLLRHLHTPQHALGPPGRRAAVALALRIARLAVASARVWAEAEADTRQGPAAAPCAAGSASNQPGLPATSTADDGAQQEALNGQQQQGRQREEPSRLLLARADVPTCLARAFSVADAALTHALPGAGWVPAAAAERWRMAVAAAADVPPAYMGGSVLRQLGDLLRPHMATSLPTAGPLPPEPPPALAAALEGGLLPCLERLVRRAGEAPDGAEAVMLTRLLWWAPVEGLLRGILVYGEPHGVAALLVSLAKALRRLMPKLLEVMAPAEAETGADGATAVAVVPGAHSAVLSACARLALFGPTWIADAMPGGNTSGGDAPSRNAAAETQMARLTSLAAQRVLPQLSYMVLRTAVADAAVTSPVFIGHGASCLYLALRALLHWLSILAPADTCEGGGDGAAEAPPAPSSVDALRLLLLERVDAVPLLGAALRLMFQHGRSFDNGVTYTLTLRRLGVACAAVAAACPHKLRVAAVSAALAAAQGRTVAEVHAAAATAAGGGGTERAGRVPGDTDSVGAGNGSAGLAAADVLWLTFWLPQQVRSLADELTECGFRSEADGVTAVAERLEGWMLGAEEEAGAAAPPGVAVGGGRSGGGTDAALTKAVCGAFAPASQLCGGLLRAACANPDCTNLAGDSERALKLQACGGCKAVAYCCRQCQTAHWRAGHKAECAGRQHK